MVQSRWDRERARLFGFVPEPQHFAIGGGWVGGSGNQGGGTTSGFIGSHGGDEDHYFTEDLRSGHWPYGSAGGYHPLAVPPPRRRDIHYEPDYLRWRQSEIDRMDAEYAAYCDERQKKFSDDFCRWRNNREGGGAPSPADPPPSADPAGNDQR